MKRLKKRIISAVLSALTLCLVTPKDIGNFGYNGTGFSASAEVIESINESEINFEYEIVSGGIIVTKWNDTGAKKASIPVKVKFEDKTLYVTGVDDFAFGLCDKLSVINVPYSLKLDKVGNTAFLTSSMVMDYLSGELPEDASTDDIVKYIADKSDYMGGNYTDDDLVELTEKLKRHMEKLDISESDTAQTKLMVCMMNIEEMGFSQTNTDKFYVWASTIPYNGLTLNGIPGTDMETYANGKGIKFADANFINGDANGDKVCNIRDAALITKKIAAGVAISVKENPSADYNGDGYVSILDADGIAADVVSEMIDSSGDEIIERESVDSREVSLSETQGMPGATVTMFLDVSAGDDFESLGAVLSWDDPDLEAGQAVSLNNSVVVSQKDINNIALGVYSPGPGALRNGSVAAIDFTIPADALPGTEYSVNFVKLDTFATTAEDITDSVGITGGKIIVADTMKLSENSIELSTGESRQLEVLGYEGDINWVSDNDSVATVKDGVVTGVGSGKATIYAVIGKIMLGCNVKVTSGLVTTTAITNPIVSKTTTVITTPVITNTMSATQNTTVSLTTSIYTNTGITVSKTLSSVTSVSSKVSDSNTSDTTSGTNVINTSSVSGTVVSQTTVSGIETSAPVTSGAVTDSTNRTTTTIKTTTVSDITTISSSSVSNSAVSSTSATTITTTGTQAPVTTTTLGSMALGEGENELDLSIGESFILVINDYDGDVIWISTNESVVKVDLNGCVSAVGEGVATIFAMFDGDYRSCTIEVKMSVILLGDANNDGVVKASDAAYIAKLLAEAALSGREISVENYTNADYNQDGKITAYDAALIAKYIANQALQPQ